MRNTILKTVIIFDVKKKFSKISKEDETIKKEMSEEKKEWSKCFLKNESKCFFSVYGNIQTECSYLVNFTIYERALGFLFTTIFTSFTDKIERRVIYSIVSYLQ